MSWALVTGACSGIGLELARDLARRGYSLVLVSDRAVELRAAAQEMAAQHGVAAQPLALDLARPDAARALYDQVATLGAEVDVLVSNAGSLLFGEMADADPEQIEALLHLHVTTPTLLAHYFGRDMRARADAATSSSYRAPLPGATSPALRSTAAPNATCAA